MKENAAGFLSIRTTTPSIPFYKRLTDDDVITEFKKTCPPPGDFLCEDSPAVKNVCLLQRETVSMELNVISCST